MGATACRARRASRTRGDEVAAQAATGAIRYDISYDPARGRWYLDASWRVPQVPAPAIEELCAAPVLAVDLNHDHLAAWAVLPDGNPAGPPVTVPLALAGLPAPHRDGLLRDAISTLIRVAKDHGCRAVAIEDLDFADARALGRDKHGRRPSRGRRGRSFRRLTGGIPTARFRDRLTQMAHNQGLSVIAVDPGAQTGRCDRRRPEDQPPESYPPSARRPPREQERQAPQGPAAAAPAAPDRATPPPAQATQDRPGPPADPVPTTAQ